ncbi:hypothetical protein PCORN_03783 [Listeria cornellensis FSL F6-0969]|uniref:Peptidase M60 domain-containing protein n=2 Tax=Listeria cornellensis TaxID=1494961 RepID=W7C4A8_9LIST|nr:hypothetical protein PCORN_03783 [Listeria cornellensis FSL F6-0969]
MKRKMVPLFFVLLASILIGGFSPPVHADEVRTKEAYVLEEPTWLDKSGMTKGRYHDRQALGIIVPAGVKLEMRQVNPKFTDELKVYFLGDGVKQPTAYVTSEWSNLESPLDLVPFIETPFTKEKPILEYRVTDQMKNLPIYQTNDNQAEFFQKWDSEKAPYGLVTSEYFQLLVPQKDEAYLKNMEDFSSINDLIHYYTDVFETFNKVAGLSFTPINLTDKNIPNKYFFKANVKGTSGSFATYNSYFTSETGDSVANLWLSKSWATAALHEIGHGYQGSFIDPMVNAAMNANTWGFDVNEVWNNLYVSAYQKKEFGKDFYTKSGYYANGGKANSESQMIKQWQQDHLPLQNWEGSSKHDLLLALNEKTDSKGFTHFNQEFRKLTNQPDYSGNNLLLLDLISKYYEEASGFDFTPVLTSAKGNISQKQQIENYYKKDKPVAPLTELVTADQLPTVQTQLDLPFSYSLVDTDQLAGTNLTGNVTLKIDIDDFSQIKDKILIIRNGEKVVREVSLTSKSIALRSLPVGIYTLDLPTGDATKYNIDSHYLRVKNGATSIPIKYTAKQASELIKQDIHFKGVNNSEYTTAHVDLNNEKLSIENNFVNANPTKQGLYSKIEVLDSAGKITYSRETIANSNLQLGTEETTIKEGYQIRVFHADPALLSIDNLTITNPSAGTHTFLVTKSGLQQKDSTTTAKDNLVTIIEKAAKIIRSNDSMLTSPYVAGKDDLLLAIQSLDEPNKSTLLNKYKDVLPNVELNPKNPLQAPILNDVYANDTEISGKSVSNNSVTFNIYNLDGSSQKYGYATEQDGKFSLSLDYYSPGAIIKLEPGMRIEISYRQGDLISPSTTKTVMAPANPYALSVDEYTLGDSALTGTFSKNIAKVRLWINDKVVTQATTNADGTFTFNNAANFITKATDKVEIVGVDASYVEKKRIAVTIKNSTITTTGLTISPYTIGDSTLSGTFGKSISKVRLWINGKVVTQATTTADGNYTFTNIGSFINNASDKVEIVGVDTQYKELNRITVPLKDLSPLDKKLTANTFQMGDKLITGTFGKNISKVRLWVNGKVVQQATTHDGNYTFTSTNYFITKPSDIVEIIGVDEQYREVSKMSLSF